MPGVCLSFTETYFDTTTGKIIDLHVYLPELMASNDANLRSDNTDTEIACGIQRYGQSYEVFASNQR